MDDLEKSDWIWNFLSRYWKLLFKQQMEIPDIESDSSDNDDDDNYDNY